MPAKNIIKVYLENSFYHIYNRSIEKILIFKDNQDYTVFLHFLKRYLSPPPENPNMIVPRWKSDIFDKIQLIAYCLMPNHFHLLVKQSSLNAIVSFMRSLANSYVHYFNKRYGRNGPLFQGNYKAVIVETEPYLLHLSRYIHLNPYELNFSNEVGPRTRSNLTNLENYPYSSYEDYLGKRKTNWIHPEEILAFFKTAQKTGLQDILSYQSFIEDYQEDPKEILGTLTID